MRRWMLWSAFWGLLGLAAMAVVGAFLGAEHARAVFTSGPMVPVWLALAVLLAGASLSSFRRRSAGLSAMHLGALLALVGGMWGSETAHELRARFLGASRIPSGCLVLPTGRATNEVFSRDLAMRIGRLPFSLRLLNFTIERYPPPDRRWRLVAEVPDDRSGERGRDGVRYVALAWEREREINVPGTPIVLTVHDYLDSARLRFAPGAGPGLRVSFGDGRAANVPVRPGEEAEDAEAGMRLRIIRVRQSQGYLEKDGRLWPVGGTGGPSGPFVEFELQVAGGQKATYHLAAGAKGSLRPHLDATVKYDAPMPEAVVSDREGKRRAVRLSLRDGSGHRARVWLVGGAEEEPVSLPLFALPGFEHEPCGDVVIWFGPPVTPVKCYRSEVEVIEGGQVIRRAAIEVNHPLRYRGYRFYQYSYDQTGERYSVLLMTSEAGVWSLYAGLVLLTAGAFWHFWLRPLARRGNRERDSGV